MQCSYTHCRGEGLQPFLSAGRKEGPRGPLILPASSAVEQRSHDILGGLHIMTCCPPGVPLGEPHLPREPFCQQIISLYSQFLFLFSNLFINSILIIRKAQRWKKFFNFTTIGIFMSLWHFLLFIRMFLFRKFLRKGKNILVFVTNFFFTFL